MLKPGLCPEVKSEIHYIYLLLTGIITVWLELVPAKNDGDGAMGKNIININIGRSLMLAIGLLAIKKTSVLGFTDTYNHWNAQCINQLAEKKLVSGYPDRTFRPDATVTRTEFAVLMLNAFPDAETQRPTRTFRDVSTSFWGYNAIQGAIQRAFFVGYPDETFRPNQAIPRTQAILVIANALAAGQATNPDPILSQYFDDAAAIPNYAKGAIAAAAQQALVINYPQVRQLRPNQNSTRGEVAALLCRALNFPSISFDYVARNYDLLDIPSRGEFVDGLAVSTGDNGRQGYIDRAGNFAIAPQYIFARNFSEGLAAVAVSGQGDPIWGYIDRDGEWVIEPGLGLGNPFSEGLAPVFKDGKYGFMDSTGTIAIQPQFNWVDNFSEGLAAVRVNGQYGYIDREGNWAIEPQAYTEADPFSEGLARVGFKNEVNQVRYGFIDKTGNAIVEPKFIAAQSFQAGLAPVQPDDESYLWGYVNQQGEWAIEPQFSAAQSFSEGLAGVMVGDRWGFINKTGELVIPAQFYQAEHYTSDGIPGTPPIGPVVRPFTDGLAAVRVGDYMGFIDQTGEFMIPPIFTDANSFVDGLARVRVGGEWYVRIENPYPDLGPPTGYYTELKGGEWRYIRSR